MLNVNLPVGTIKLMIDANPQSVLAADEFGQTALHIACRHRCIDGINVIKLLFNADKDILLTPDASGELPLHIACRSGKCDLVQWILERTGAGLSVQNNEGMMPIQKLLHNANCNRNSLEWVQAVYALLLRAHPEALVDLLRAHPGAVVDKIAVNRCTIDYANGDTLECEVKNGRPEGKGVKTFANGRVLECDGWKDGKANGKGVLTFSRWDGRWKHVWNCG
jgi:hypothetical protein